MIIPDNVYGVKLSPDQISKADVGVKIIWTDDHIKQFINIYG